MNISLLTSDIRSEHDVMLARQRARHIAHLLSFDMQDQTRIATAVSEIARNAVQYAGSGRVEFRLAEGLPQSLLIIIKDDGPGITDIETLLLPSASLLLKRGDSLRGVRRLMDEFFVVTAPTKGTQITLGKRRPRHLPLLLSHDIARITQELMQQLPENPLTEMQRQNQELLHTLQEVRSQQEEGAEHLEKIETLNLRLGRAIQASHHRVKNNLQLISALVELQTDTTETSVPTEALVRIGQHSRALAMLHDVLTHDTYTDAETETISAKAALEKLIPLFQATTGGRRIISHIEDFNLPVQESASLAMLISELISNAIKHGDNDIELTMMVSGNSVTLEVCNDGSGFPSDFDWRKAANTGLMLIDSTGRHDLKGIIFFENRAKGGACVRVTFPINPLEPNALTDHRN